MSDGVNLVTGYSGTTHITAEDDGGGYAAIIGTGNYVSNNVGQGMRAEMPDANTLRIYDGEAFWGGRHVRIPTGTYVDVPIKSGSQGQVRRDIVGFRYTKDAASGKEDVVLECIEGTPGSDTDPGNPGGSPIQGDSDAFWALYRVRLSGISADTPVALYNKVADFASVAGAVNALDPSLAKVAIGTGSHITNPGGKDWVSLSVGQIAGITGVTPGINDHIIIDNGDYNQWDGCVLGTGFYDTHKACKVYLSSAVSNNIRLQITVVKRQ